MCMFFVGSCSAFPRVVIRLAALIVRICYGHLPRIVRLEPRAFELLPFFTLFCMCVVVFYSVLRISVNRYASRIIGMESLDLLILMCMFFVGSCSAFPRVVIRPAALIVRICYGHLPRIVRLEPRAFELLPFFTLFCMCVVDFYKF